MGLKFKSFLLIAVLFVSFSCKKDEKGHQKVLAEAEKGSQEVVNFITWNDDYLSALKTKVPKFEKETGIKVNWKMLSEDIVREKVLLDLASKAGEFDLVLTDVWILPEHVKSDYLEPLSNFIKDDKEFSEEKWYRVFLDALTLNGHLYALPMESFGAALVYRKDLFQKFGIKVPSTIPELETAAAALTRDLNGDKVIDIYGVVSRAKAGEEPAIIVSGFVWAYGGSWFEKNASTADEIKKLKAKPSFNSPEFERGFTKYCELLKKYGPPGIKDYTWYEIIRDGREGKAAMLFYSGYNVGAVDHPKYGMRDKYYAALPVRGPKNYIQEDFVMGYGINKNSKHKDAAWKFLKFITNEEFMSDVIEDYATSIPIKPIREGQKYREMHPYLTPEQQYVLEKNLELIDWNYMPHIPEYSVIADMLGVATSQVVAGTSNPKEALKRLNDAVYNLMKQSGYYE